MSHHQKKIVENLSRTGIEYPMMKELGHEPFITTQKEFEKLYDVPARQSLLDEYMRNDADRTINCSSGNNFSVVYDYFETSPYYEGENSKYGPYIDEKDIIERDATLDVGLVWPWKWESIKKSNPDQSGFGARVSLGQKNLIRY